MSFLTRLRVDCYAPGGEIADGEFLVVAPLVYQHGASLITVPAGFVTDFASIPRAVRLLPGFDVNGRSRAAAVLHDMAYSSHGMLVLRTVDRETSDWRDVPTQFTRAQCDALFHEALRSLGVNAAIAGAMYAGVRAGGWLYWNKRRTGLIPGYDLVDPIASIPQSNQDTYA